MAEKKQEPTILSHLQELSSIDEKIKALEKAHASRSDPMDMVALKDLDDQRLAVHRSMDKLSEGLEERYKANEKKTFDENVARFKEWEKDADDCLYAAYAEAPSSDLRSEARFLLRQFATARGVCCQLNPASPKARYQLFYILQCAASNDENKVIAATYFVDLDVEPVPVCVS